MAFHRAQGNEQFISNILILLALTDPHRYFNLPEIAIIKDLCLILHQKCQSTTLREILIRISFCGSRALNKAIFVATIN